MAQNDDAHALSHPEVAQQARRVPATETNAYVDGIFGGLLGAAVIAVFFLAIDLAEGEPLRTPGALGASLFLRQPLEPGAEPVLSLVLGYTVLHGVMFVTAGVVASVLLVGRTRPLGPLSGLGLATALFVGLEIFFVALIALAAPDLIAVFGAGRIAMANMLAAGAMAVVLLRPRGQEHSMVGQRVVFTVLLGLMLTMSFLVYWCSSAYVELAE